MKRDSKGRFAPKTSEVRANQANSVVNAQNQFELRTMNALMNRLQLAARVGLQFDGARDLYTVFGYKRLLTPEDILAKYVRQDIASRIVDAPPNATWTNPPSIKDNEEAKNAFDPIASRVKLWNAMHRADRMARMYPFSLLLFGFTDTGKLEKPVRSTRMTSAGTPSSRTTDLAYVRAIGARQVTEIKFNTDPRDPRFGLPEMYRIKFDDPRSKYASGSGITSTKQQELTVHHSRVVHIVENPLEDLIFATPVMERVFNLLEDLLKISGGTAETFWLNGRGGMQANVDKEMELDPEDAKDLSEEIEEFQHQLRRIIRTRGVDINMLELPVPNPTYAFDMIMSLISGTTGIPRRILLGSEAGQLASEQDRANWADRIEERRSLFATPWVLTPTIQTLQAVGLIPEGDVEWEWPSAFIQNPLEEGQTMAQIARSVGNLSRQTGNQTPMQLLSREECRTVIGFEGDLPEGDIYEPPEYQMPESPQGDEDEDTEDEVGTAPTGKAPGKAPEKGQPPTTQMDINELATNREFVVEVAKEIERRNPGRKTL